MIAMAGQYGRHSDHLMCHVDETEKSVALSGVRPGNATLYRGTKSRQRPALPMADVMISVVVEEWLLIHDKLPAVTNSPPTKPELKPWLQLTRAVEALPAASRPMLCAPAFRARLHAARKRRAHRFWCGILPTNCWRRGFDSLLVSFQPANAPGRVMTTHRRCPPSAARRSREKKKNGKGDHISLVLYAGFTNLTLPPLPAG